MSQRSDILRQVVVIAAVCGMIVAAMVGTGLFGGTSVRDLQGGALDADATVLAPARPAFGIWTVIYLLMIAYAVWQALPGHRASRRQRAAGWWIAATAVLNGAWLLAAQFLDLLATVVAIAVLLVTLGLTVRVLAAHRAESVADVVVTDVMVGLHLGWVSLATVANITAWLATDVIAVSEAAAQAIGIVVLIVVAAIGVAIAFGTGSRLAPGLAMAWGLVWIAVARATGELHSAPVAVTAGIAAVVVVLAPALLLIAGRGRGELAR